MSNKLVRIKEEQSKINEKQKKIIFLISVMVLNIAFIFVWINIFRVSEDFEEKMDKMILGKDYFIEDIVITDKRVETGTDNILSENYFLYYHNGKTADYHKRMQVPRSIYLEYNVGDTISAYTTNHIKYAYKKTGIFPSNQFSNNELMKAFGVLLGDAILTLIFLKIFKII